MKELAIKKENKVSGLIVCIFIFLLTACFLALNRIESPDIRISEVCTHNVGIVHNSAGYYEDYIELYNNSDRYITLDGMYLSDNKKNLYQYELEYYELSPYEYALIFISDDSCGFSLSDTDTLYLVNEKGFVCDKVEITTMDDGQVYCQDIENKQWYISEIATPEAANIFISNYQSTISAPTASVSGGKYNDAFYLELSGDGDIYYTLDGSVPDKNSNKYSEAIYIYDRSNEDNYPLTREDISTLDWHFYNEEPTSKATVLRAVVYQDDNYGQELTETYFIGNNINGYNELPILSLISDPDNLFGYDNGIYVKGMVYDLLKDQSSDNPHTYKANYRMKGKGWRRDACIEYYDVEGNKEAVNDIEISIHGGHSCAYVQKSFNVYSVGDNGGLFELFGNNLSSLVLKAAGSCSGVEDIAPRVRDYVNQKLIGDMNVLNQDSKLVQLYINGEYWGVYALLERIDQSFISRHYDVNSEDVMIIKYSADGIDIISNDENDTNEFEELLDKLEDIDLSDNDNYQMVSDCFDIDELIDYFAIEFYLNNFDWLLDNSAINNFAVWKDKSDNSDGKWHFIVYDIDGTADIGINALASNNPFIDSNGNIRRIKLFAKLIENAEFLQRFEECYLNLAENEFSYERVKEYTENEFVKYQDSFIETMKRFHDADYTEEDFYEEIESYLNFFRDRPQYASEHINELHVILGGND